MFRVDVRFRIPRWVKFVVTGFLAAILAVSASSCQRAPESSTTTTGATQTVQQQVRTPVNLQYYFAAANIGETAKEKNLLSLLYKSVLETQDIPGGQYLNFFHFVQDEPITLLHSGEVEQRSIATYNAIKEGFLKNPGDLSRLKMLSSSLSRLGEVLGKVPTDQVVLAHIALDTTITTADEEYLKASWKLIDKNAPALGRLCIVIPEAEQNKVSVTIPESVKGVVQMTSWKTRESSCLVTKLPLHN